MLDQSSEHLWSHTEVVIRVIRQSISIKLLWSWVLWGVVLWYLTIFTSKWFWQLIISVNFLAYACEWLRVFLQLVCVSWAMLFWNLFFSSKIFYMREQCCCCFMILALYIDSEHLWINFAWRDGALPFWMWVNCIFSSKLTLNLESPLRTLNLICWPLYIEYSRLSKSWINLEVPLENLFSPLFIYSVTTNSKLPVDRRVLQYQYLRLVTCYFIGNNV